MRTEELHGADGPVSETAVRGKYTELTLWLIRRGLTITTMESCTSGQIASLITDTEGSSAVLKGAFVTYSNEAKIMQGVPAAIIGTYGVYSAETAAAMAEACRAAYRADIGTGVTTETFHCTIPVQASRLAYKLYMADVIADRLALEIKI